FRSVMAKYDEVAMLGYDSASLQMIDSQVRDILSFLQEECEKENGIRIPSAWLGEKAWFSLFWWLYNQSEHEQRDNGIALMKSVFSDFPTHLLDMSPSRENFISLGIERGRAPLANRSVMKLIVRVHSIFVTNASMEGRYLDKLIERSAPRWETISLAM